MCPVLHLCTKANRLIRGGGFQVLFELFARDNWRLFAAEIQNVQISFRRGLLPITQVSIDLRHARSGIAIGVGTRLPCLQRWREVSNWQSLGMEGSERWMKRSSSDIRCGSRKLCSAKGPITNDLSYAPALRLMKQVRVYPWSRENEIAVADCA